MTRERLFGNMCVRDVYRSIVEQPALIKPDADVVQLLRAVTADTRTRHVYVVDNEDRLIGSARLMAIAEYLFPFTSVLKSGGGLLAPTVDLEEKKVRDLMNDQPASVLVDAPLADAVTEMMREGITELPVVNAGGHVIGQVNMYEIIEAYLNCLPDDSEQT